MILSPDLVFLFCALVGALCYAWSLRRDCRSFLKSVQALRQGASTERSSAQRNQAKSMRTSIGRAFQCALEALRYQQETLGWELSLAQVSSEKRRSEGLSQGENGSFDGYLKQFLTELRSEFRFSAACVAISDGRRWCSGVGGWRFDENFRRVFSAALQAKDPQVPVFFDCVNAMRPQGDFSLFGVRFELAQIVSLDGQRGLVWLGYSSEKPPTETEKRRFPSRVVEFEKETQHLFERRKLSERAENAESQSASNHKLIAEMSHDIRSPLGNIKGILNVMRLEGFAPDTPELLDVAVSNCDAMGEIVEALIDFSRIQTSALVARKEVFDVNAVVRSVADSYRATARIRKLRFEVSVSEQPILVEADRMHLKRILSNLLSNAFKYTEAGTISVQVNIEPTQRLSIQVVDTGRGLSAEQLHKLYTPFERFHSDMADGLGLGLALTKSLADLNGMSLVVSSEVGSGSKFGVELAALADESGSEGGRCSPEEPPISSARATLAIDAAKHLLVVDDDRDCVDTLVRALVGAGFRAEGAYSVEAALKQLERVPFDAIISDAQMPRGGVEKILTQLALMKFPPPCIVLSGSSASTDRLLRSGALAVLKKPAELEELRRSLDQAIRAAELARNQQAA